MGNEIETTIRRTPPAGREGQMPISGMPQSSAGSSSFRKRLTIRSGNSIKLTDEEKAHAGHVAAAILSTKPHLSSTQYFGDEVTAGLGDGPAVIISDRSEIRLLLPDGTDNLEYRMSVLIDTGDVQILTGSRNEGFEAYIDNLLSADSIKRIQLLQAPDSRTSVSQRCMDETDIFATICRMTRANGGTTLIPYISTGSVWTLAKHINEATGCPVKVAGPPPRLSAFANDKLCFSEVVTALFGQSSVPPIRAAHSSAGLTSHVYQLAQKWENIVVKVPDSAGSAGNFPLQSEAVKNMSGHQLHNHLQEIISGLVTSDDYPLLVQVWDSDVVASPSAQLWIPRKIDGQPILEGIFEQVLVGQRGTFSGAVQANLSGQIKTLFCKQAMLLATTLQEMGYVGRCSFDSVLIRHENNLEELHWIECNGRWGGVSLPMSLMNRLFNQQDMPEYIVVQRSGLDYQGRPFNEFLNAFDESLYAPGRPPHGIIVTNPTGIERGVGLQMIAFGQNINEATEHLNEVFSGLGIVQT